MSKKISTLTELVAKIGSQYKVAKDFKVVQGTIQQAVTSERHIFILEDEKGVKTAFEIKPLYKTKPDLNPIIEAVKGLYSGQK